MGERQTVELERDLAQMDQLLRECGYDPGDFHGPTRRELSDTRLWLWQLRDGTPPESDIYKTITTLIRKVWEAMSRG